MVENAKRSGLRSKFAATRLETAKIITQNILDKQYPKHVIKNQTLVIGDLHSAVLASTPERANHGGFEIRAGKKQVGFVEINLNNIPLIHVLKESTPLGLALAAAFKKHAKFWVWPLVRIRSNLPKTSDYQASNALSEAMIAKKQEQKRMEFNKERERLKLH
ncbi:MAG: hypothetical protein ABH803_01645 [Candidatus Micrarchaeota archaeon]